MNQRSLSVVGVFLFATACASQSDDRASISQVTGARAAAGAEPVLRVGNLQWLRRSRNEEEFLNPLVYSNHLPKSFAFETLVRTDARGRILPGLATAWEVTPDRRTWTFQLRPTARFHDGAPCDAAAVVRYFESWLVSDEDRFVGACERIRSVRALDATTVEFQLSEGYPLDLDLALANPMAIVGHGLGRTPEGLTTLIGTGPWKMVEHEWMSRARYERFDEFDGAKPKLPAFEYEILTAGSERDPIGVWALQRGRIDVLIESWRPSIDREGARRLVEKGGFELIEERGSMVQLLCFNDGDAPFDDLAWRARVQQTVDRAALVRAGELGFADPVTTLFDPRLDDWPDQSVGPMPPLTKASARARATLLALESDPAQVRLCVELARQLAPAGLDVEVAYVSAAVRAERIERGEFDLYIHRTWGAPYDPHATLYDRLGLRVPERVKEASGISAQFHEDPQLQELVESSWRADTTAARRSAYHAIQGWLDAHAALVPLYVPRRIALVREGVKGLRIGEDIYRIDFTGLELEKP